MRISPVLGLLVDPSRDVPEPNGIVSARPVEAAAAGFHHRAHRHRSYFKSSTGRGARPCGYRRRDGRPRTVVEENAAGGDGVNVRAHTPRPPRLPRKQGSGDDHARASGWIGGASWTVGAGSRHSRRNEGRGATPSLPRPIPRRALPDLLRRSALPLERRGCSDRADAVPAPRRAGGQKL